MYGDIGAMSTPMKDPFGWVGSTMDDKFYIEAVIGRGGFGIVYRATHLSLSKPVAIKCLHVAAAFPGEERDALVEKFKIEAQLLHDLASQTANIVRLMHYGTATSPTGHFTPFMVMEWLNGHALDDFIKAQSGPMGLAKAIELLDPAVKAIALAHDEHISHRDIKPANLFLITTKTGQMIKVIDFGIAKVFEEAPTPERALLLTGTGPRAFTPRYGAPEQYDTQHGGTGPWTDVFALALVLIELASKKVVIEGEAIYPMYRHSITAYAKTDLFVKDDDVPRWQEDVIRRALHPDLQRRYQHARDFWSALCTRPPTLTPPAYQGPIDFASAATVLQPLSRGPRQTPLPPRSLTPRELTRPLLSNPLPSIEPLSDPHPISSKAPNKPTSKRPSVLPVSGENRICTIVHIDLACVLRSAVKLSPERRKEIGDRHFRIVEEQGVRLGGLVQRPSSDSALVLFGIPRAEDNDVERAVVAALRIRSAINRLTPIREAKQVAPTVRIGISTGHVFAQQSDLASAPISFVGEPVAVASRLQQMAKDGDILITRESHRHVTGSFDAEAMPPMAIENTTEPIAVVRILRHSRLRPVFPSPDFHGLETRFIGRESELSKIVDTFGTVVSEQRTQIVSIIGAPGLGRTRLISEALSKLRAHADAPLIMVGQGAPLLRDITYAFVATMLRRRFEIEESDSVTEIRKKLRRGLRWARLRATAQRHRGEIDDGDDEATNDEFDNMLSQVEIVLGIRDDLVILGDFSDESSNLIKPRISAAISRMMRFIAKRMPIVILCNDLQWADDASLDLLDELSRNGADLPICFIFATRPELFESRPQWGEDQEGHVRMDLAPLGRRHIEEMVRNRLRLIPNLPAEIVRLVADRAEGYPRIAEETLHLLLDTGVLEKQNDNHWMIHLDKLGAVALPTTIQGIVQARIDRLDPDVSHILFRAAIIGRTFWYGALESMCRDDALVGLALESRVRLLRDRLFVRRRKPSSIANEEEYVFMDSATHEVAYQMPANSVLGPLHLQAAKWLQSKILDQNPVLVAHHYERGGDLGRAGMVYERAASHAAALGELAEALRHVERARDLYDMALIEDVDEFDTAPKPLAVSSTDCVRVRIAIGDVLRRMGRLDEAVATYTEARERIPRGDSTTTREFDLFMTVHFDARLDYRLGLVERTRGALNAALVHVERAIMRADSIGAIEELPPMFATLVFLNRRTKRFDEAFVVAKRAIEICRQTPIENRDQVWKGNVVESLLGLAVALLGKRKLVAAERTYRQAARMISESTAPQQLSLAYNGIAGVRMMQGDAAEARTYLIRSIRLKERLGEPHQLAIAYSNLTELDLRVSNVEAAVEHAKKSVKFGEQARAAYDLAEMYQNLARALLAANEVDEALDAGKKSLTIANESGPIYLAGAATVVAQCCARVVQEKNPNTAVLAKATSLAHMLSQVLSRFAHDTELRQRASEWLTLIDPLLIRAT